VVQDTAKHRPTLAVLQTNLLLQPVLKERVNRGAKKSGKLSGEILEVEETKIKGMGESLQPSYLDCRGPTQREGGEAILEGAWCLKLETRKKKGRGGGESEPVKWQICINRRQQGGKEK